MNWLRGNRHTHIAGEMTSPATNSCTSLHYIENPQRRQTLNWIAKCVLGSTAACLPLKIAHATTSYNSIAAPDRAAAQTLLALGIVPKASVSAAFFNEMGTMPPMPGDVIDCGDPIEPNLEVLRRLDIDLIITGTIPADIQDVLRRIAPVFAMDIYTGKTNTLNQAKTETLRLANFLNRPAVGRDYIDMVEKTISTHRTRLRQSQRPVFLAGLAGDGRNMTIYAHNSIMCDVMEAMGVESAWTGPTNEFGFVNAGIETLASMPDASLIHIDYGSATDAALSKLSTSPFWTNLPMVKAGRIHRIPRFEVFGGLPLASQFAPLLANTLLDTGVK